MDNLTFTNEINKQDNPLTLSIYSWNINGLKDKLKTNLIHLYMNRNPGVYLLQEIHNPDDYTKQRFNSQRIVHYKHGTEHTSGVALCIPNKDINLLMHHHLLI